MMKNIYSDRGKGGTGMRYCLRIFQVEVNVGMQAEKMEGRRREGLIW